MKKHEQKNSDTYFLTRLRDKIIEAESEPLFENNINNVTHLEHPEDLVFLYGSKGFKNALKILQSLDKETNNITIKWDGTPAIIFGRNNNGQFVLTDKFGFTAKTYNGHAKNIDDIKRIMSTRHGDKTDLIAIYTKLFPLLSNCIPRDFKGYIWGDLLYYNKPKIKNGSWIFTPNTVTYQIPIDSDLGHSIADSDIGIAVHTYVTTNGESLPISQLAKRAHGNKQVLFFSPEFVNAPHIIIPTKYQNQIKNLIQYANDIDELLSPQTLRMIKISDFPLLMKRFINAKVSEGNFNKLASTFINWLPSAANENKAKRMKQHILRHKFAVKTIFNSFILLSKIKNNIIQQLDNQNDNIKANINGESGHEGYVVNTKLGTIKLVDRIRFSKANFEKNQKNT